MRRVQGPGVGTLGDIHAPDPGCINNRDYWESLLVGEVPVLPSQKKG